MRKRKGFTFIEIIFSVIILAILAMFLLSGIVYQMQTLSASKVYAKDTYDAMQKMESKIQKVKDDIDANIALDPASRQNMTLFGVLIDIYKQEVIINASPSAEDTNNRKLIAYVGDARPPVLGVPEIDKLEIRLMRYNTIMASLYTGEGTRIESEVHVYDPLGVFSSASYQWYISEPSFPISSNEIPVTNPLSSIAVPIFPSDYSVMVGQTSDEIPSLTIGEAGRHLVLAATPKALSGKTGTQYISTPIYIEGLTVTSGLIGHFQASVNYASVIRNSGGSSFLTTATDTSGNAAPFKAASAAKEPRIATGVVGVALRGGVPKDVYSNYVVLDNSEMSMPCTSTSICVFAVCKSDENSQVVGNGSWNIQGSPAWQIVGKNTSNSGAVRIGFAGKKGEVAEVIVFNRALSAVEMDDVTNYLKLKYGL